MLAFCLAYFIVKDGSLNFILRSRMLSFVLNSMLATWSIAIVIDMDLKFILDFLAKISFDFEIFF